MNGYKANFLYIVYVFDNQEYNNRRAGGDSLWIESHKRSEAETCRNSRGSTVRYFVLESISFMGWRMSRVQKFAKEALSQFPILLVQTILNFWGLNFTLD